MPISASSRHASKSRVSKRRRLIWLLAISGIAGCATGTPSFRGMPGMRSSLAKKQPDAVDSSAPAPTAAPESSNARTVSFQRPSVNKVPSGDLATELSGKHLLPIIAAEKVAKLESSELESWAIKPSSLAAENLPSIATPPETAASNSGEASQLTLNDPRSTNPPSMEWNDDLLDDVEDSLIGATTQSAGGEFAGTSMDAIRVDVTPRNATDIPDSFRDLTESEMLQTAMASSPTLRRLGVRILDNPAGATTHFDPAITATDPFFGPAAALSSFDSQLFANLTAANNDRVFNNTTLGGGVQELTQDLVNSNVGMNRQTTTGATLQFSAQHLYDNNDRTANIFQNYYETQWEAGVRQPLLRGAGKEFNLIAGPNARPGFNFSNGIIIARLNNEVSDAEFVIEVRKFVQDLYTAYWNLQQSYREYDAVVEAAEVAKKTWLSVKARRDAEVTGGEAYKEAQARADYFTYLRQIQTSLGGSGNGNGLYDAERRLRRLMGIAVLDQQLLRPVDPPVDARFEFDFETLGAQAMTGRTELRRQSVKVQQQEYRLIAAKNFLLPQLDVIGRYRLRGLGDDLTGGGQRFSSAYKDFFSLDHQEWEFGVEMGVTAGRRQAHAAVRNAHLQLQRERSVMDQIEKEVRLDVAAAHAEVASSYAALETTRMQLEAARERFEASTVMFDADKLQIEFLLDAQQDLLSAQLQVAADQSRYALALVGIGASTGKLLKDVGVYVNPSHCGASTVAF